MSTKPQKLQPLQPEQPKSPASYITQEHQRWESLFALQPVMIQRYLHGQARSLAESLLQPASQARFRLPDRVIVLSDGPQEMRVPPEHREQIVGGFKDRLIRTGIGAALRQRMDELEASTDLAISVSAGLLRFATATFMVSEILPSGRSVRYQAAEGEEIPTLPVVDFATSPVTTAATDAIVWEGHTHRKNGHEELLVPYVPAARVFFLPKWVAFDQQDHLLVRSLAEAEAHLASMQRYVHTLHTAVSLASYMIANAAYQQKRYGMLGQLINQGRNLARFLTREIINTIQSRAAVNDLNRGLSLTVPYFDDQDLEMKKLDFDVIPAGRIMFIPAFVVLAVRKELGKVEQDTRLNRSTRIHLLAELHMLEEAFANTSNQ